MLKKYNFDNIYLLEKILKDKKIYLGMNNRIVINNKMHKIATLNSTHELSYIGDNIYEVKGNKLTEIDISQF
jgi:hypothetical protein